MTNDPHNPNDLRVNFGGASLEWFWSAPWLAVQHKNVPFAVLLRGIGELDLRPVAIADGKPVYSAAQYARLQQWIIAQADQDLAEATATAPLEPSAEHRAMAAQGIAALLDELVEAGDADARRELVLALCIAVGEASDEAALAQRGGLIQALEAYVESGDAAQLDVAREWITTHILAGAVN